MINKSRVLLALDATIVFCSRLICFSIATLWSAQMFAIEALGQESAPSAGPPQPSFSELLGRMFPMFIVVFFIYYMMVLRPQNQKLRTKQTLLGSLKRGDVVVTSSGMVAKVAGVENEFVLLEVANNVKLKFEASHINRKFEKAEAEKSVA